MERLDNIRSLPKTPSVQQETEAVKDEVETSAISSVQPLNFGEASKKNLPRWAQSIIGDDPDNKPSPLPKEEDMQNIFEQNLRRFSMPLEELKSGDP